MTGIRIGAGVALLATIASEMLAGQSGLGFLLYDAAFSLRTPEMFAIMAATGALGLLFNALVRQASRLVVGWHLAMTALDRAGMISRLNLPGVLFLGALAGLWQLAAFLDRSPIFPSFVTVSGR